eukprot:820727-Rhodomonas_salina.1
MLAANAHHSLRQRPVLVQQVLERPPIHILERDHHAHDFCSTTQLIPVSSCGASTRKQRTGSWQARVHEDLWGPRNERGGGEDGTEKKGRGGERKADRSVILGAVECRDVGMVRAVKIAQLLHDDLRVLGERNGHDLEGGDPTCRGMHNFVDGP